jgi:hypothetical protein
MAASLQSIDAQQVEQTLARLFLASGDEAPSSQLRREDRKKAVEVGALLEELRPLVSSRRGGAPGVLVDAAAGKSAVGLLAAELLLRSAPRPWRLLAIERDADRARAFEVAAARREAVRVSVELQQVALQRASWPSRPDVVCALHACGAASDAVIDGAVAAEARWLLLAPCCYGAGVRGRGDAGDAPPAQELVRPLAEALGLPEHGLLSRRFAQSLIDGERTLRLEAAGYHVEVVELVPPTVTPFNLLWRARWIGETGRSVRASERLARLGRR